MHPVTRVAGLVALAIGLASAHPLSLCLATVLLALLATAGGIVKPVFVDPPRRLKWLLLSVVVLYGFLVPGDVVLGDWAPVSPTRQGLLEGLLRAWMLLLMAGAARALMATTSREALVGALYWLTRPLERVGIHAARFCLRLVLTLEYAVTLRRGQPAPADGRSEGFTRRAAALARERLDDAEARAAEARPGPVTIPLCGAPPWWQWLLPLALLAALAGLARLS